MNFVKAVKSAIEKDAYWGDRVGTATEAVIRHATSRDGKETVIVSRHPGAVEWLRRKGITGTVVEQATEDDVRGKLVVGNLPLHLATLTHQIGSIDLPNLSRDQRGRDLSPEEMDAAGACIRWYMVEQVE